MSTQQSTQQTVDFAAVKTRQQAMWASGDFAVVGTTLQIVGETLCEAVNLRAGSRVLDVACGNGNASLAAARRFCTVTGLDYVPSLLENARLRATAENLPLELELGDAEQLPFADRSFDYVLSTYGVMFAPNQQRAASELTRVCARGGRIGLANWTPEGFIGGLLRTVGKHVAPPPGLSSPLLWGNEARLQELFAGAAKISCERKNFNFRYRSPAHFIEVFRRFYGPTHKAFEALPAAGQQALSSDIVELIARFDVADEGALCVPGEYLEVVVQL